MTPQRSLSLLLLALAAPASAQTLKTQPAPLPRVTLSAPGYAAQAEVRKAVVYPESGPNVGPTFQFSPAQVRVTLNRPGERWKPGFVADMPPAYVTVTPVQNWLTLYKGPAARLVKERLDLLRKINAGKQDMSVFRNWLELPYFPLVNMAQAVTGSVQRMKTPQLQGVRYLAIYSQETSVEYPRSMVFYTFQGLTHDGKHLVSVRLPYAPKSFPVEAGQSVSPENGWLAYRQRAMTKLDAENGKLAALDALVRSIRVR
ncbi:hypothetical protein SAMN04488058_10337 [Deinococcus reticulitermitis]|uniref:Uncharacterized protein n=1 Tax=Deinococcus reticulitermitis TaxID=856736 RepID=A0A1H6VG68_9DEIO|nr:hypothetical protein [Deinococcus reticulitermitis]SEI99205.1 hypothetical protein SAMN04488058_10337 [Deinococcus reticulitermitis]